MYSICCINECEELMVRLEGVLARPTATSSAVVSLVAGMSSSTVQGPRNLSRVLISRLHDIADSQGGVPLHGRLFAQWMHFAFPRECPYPHLAGTTYSKGYYAWRKENPHRLGKTASFARAVPRVNASTDDVDGTGLMW